MITVESVECIAVSSLLFLVLWVCVLSPPFFSGSPLYCCPPFSFSLSYSYFYSVLIMTFIFKNLFNVWNYIFVVFISLANWFLLFLPFLFCHLISHLHQWFGTFISDMTILKLSIGRKELFQLNPTNYCKFCLYLVCNTFFKSFGHYCFHFLQIFRNIYRSYLEVYCLIYTCLDIFQVYTFELI